MTSASREGRPAAAPVGLAPEDLALLARLGACGRILHATRFAESQVALPFVLELMADQEGRVRIFGEMSWEWCLFWVSLFGWSDAPVVQGDAWTVDQHRALAHWVSERITALEVPGGCTPGLQRVLCHLAHGDPLAPQDVAQLTRAGWMVYTRWRLDGRERFYLRPLQPPGGFSAHELLELRLTAAVEGADTPLVRLAREAAVGMARGGR